MKYRHEWKHEISCLDKLIVCQRLSAIAKRDIHAINGTYFVRSLYFDNASDKVLREKIDGVSQREKFRIRFYNNDTSVLRLEKKNKLGGLCLKESACLTKEQASDMIHGNFHWMMDCGVPLVRELYSKITSQGLRPKTIVDYIREPFVFAPGNVRVTIDDHIRTGISCTDFLNLDCVTVPAGDAPVILEVKWDEYLPDIIRDAIWLEGRRAGAFSKYAACRIYG